jgi:cyanophycin synthetase
MNPDLDKMKISTRLIAEEALRRGLSVKYLLGGRTKTGVLIIGDGKSRIIIKSTVGALTKGYGVFVATNKFLMSQLLSEFGLPTPTTMVYSDELSVNAFLDKYKKLVVKPIDTNHGVGITTDITTKEELATAIDRAQKAAKNSAVLVQEMVSGIDHRFLVVGDKLVAAAYREPTFVVGDGVRTIGQLIDEENTNPLRGSGHSKPLSTIDKVITGKHMSKIGKSLDLVLPKGEKLALSGVANLSQGGRAIDVTDSVHPSIAEIAVKATKVAGLGVCGVDIMCDDITKDAAVSLPKIIELNESPGIRMHHFPSKGAGRDVASAILDQALMVGGLSL